MTITEMLQEMSNATSIEKQPITATDALNEAYHYARPSSFSRGMRLDLGGIAILLISGTASIDDNGETLHVGDFRAQTRRTFDNITALLAAEGATWKDIVRPPATCATSTATTRRSTKSAPRSTRSRDSIRCRLRRASRPSCAVRNCWWKSKRSRCSGTADGVAAGTPSAWRCSSRAQARSTRRPVRAAPIRRVRRESRTAAVCRRAGGPAAILEVHRSVLRDTTASWWNTTARRATSPPLKPEDVDEVRIGFLGPVENHPDERLGKAMLNGAQLAIDEANAAGGYGGKPFKLMLHNDPAIWGASSNEMVKMAYDDKVWAMLGSISGDSTHIALRVSLKAEVPIVNSAATDPTIPETIIPWYLTTIQDDRVQGYTLARRIYTRPRTEEDRAAACQRPLRPLRRHQVQGCLAPAGTSGGDRAEVPARRHGFSTRLAHHQRLARGRNRALGRCGPGGNDPEADARNGHEAAGLRQLPRAGRRLAAQCRGRGGGTGDRVSVRPHARRSGLACLQPALRKALRRPPGCLRLAGVRHDEYSAAGDLPRRV